FFFLQAEDGIRDFHVTGVQTCALPILCENHAVSPEPTYGNSNDQCGTWNTATVSGVDSDPVPASQQHLTTATASYPLSTGDGVRSEERRVGKGGSARSVARPITIA